MKRLERLAGRHEALTQTVELLSHEVRAMTRNIGRLTGDVDKVYDIVTQLTSPARRHEERISRIKDNG